MKPIFRLEAEIPGNLVRQKRAAFRQNTEADISANKGREGLKAHCAIRFRVGRRGEALICGRSVVWSKGDGRRPATCGPPSRDQPRSV